MRPKTLKVRNTLTLCLGYSEKAQRKDKPTAYLEPNRNSMHYPKRGRSVLAVSAVISMLKLGALNKGRESPQSKHAFALSR
jgi:hypothetical protein